MNQETSQKNKTPTLKQKVQMYEDFLHRINTFVITGNNQGISELIQNADDWSYSHRVGNGENSDKLQQKIINKSFWKLCDTPIANAETKERQDAWSKRTRQTNRAFINIKTK